MSLTHLSSPFSDIKKIEKIEKKQFPSPATKREVPRVETAVHSNGRIKENEIIIQSQELGDNKGIYNIKSLFDVTHGASTHEITTIAPTPLQSDTLLFKRDPNVTKAGGYNNLDIRASGDQFGFNEPFIVKPIPDSGGNSIKFGYNRDGLPILAAAEDLKRNLKFYTTSKGLLQIAKENITNLAIGAGHLDPYNPLGWVMAPPIPAPMTGFLNFYQDNLQTLGRASLRKPFTGVRSTDVANAFNLTDQGDSPLPAAEKVKKALEKKLEKTFDAPAIIRKPLQKLFNKAVNKLAEVQYPLSSPFTNSTEPTSFISKVDKTDPFSNADSIDDDGIMDAAARLGDSYIRFRDLREGGKHIYFRGYISGITENVTPSFNPIQYIGRSEDVYTYQKGERDISFNLKMYPANIAEFDSMYKKMNILTSLAYPNYRPEESDGVLFRMQAPFTELYMGHIGDRGKGQFGFIKSLTYTVPESGDYDARTAVPRHFEAAISYQILNKRPPNMNTRFYGRFNEYKR